MEQEVMTKIGQCAVLTSKERAEFAEWVDHVKVEANQITTVIFRTVSGHLVDHPIEAVIDWQHIPHINQPDALTYFEILNSRIESILMERSKHLVSNWFHADTVRAIARRYTVSFFRDKQNEGGRFLNEYESEASAANAIRLCGEIEH